MAAQQTAVEVTGQNLANANNTSYARQRVEFETSPTVTVDPKVGPQGTGVNVAAIRSYRDVLLDDQINAETSVSSYWTAQQEALQNAQTQLGEFLDASVTSTSSTSSSTSLSTQLSSLFNAFQEVAANPASLTQRQALIDQAQTLASSLNQAAQRLSDVNERLNTQVTIDVDSANQLLSAIADLNGQIRTAEASGGTANDLRDMRQAKLEELAELVNFDTTTTADGGVDISIDGVQLVSGRQVMDTLEAYDAGGGELMVRTATGGTALTLSSGSIQGTIDARDGALDTLRTGLDTLAATLITEVNAIYNPASGASYSLTGSSGDDFFTGTDAATIDVYNPLKSNPALLQVAGVVNAPGDNSVALALGQLGQTAQAALNGQTFDEAYSGLVASLGSALSGANDQVTSNDAVKTMLLKQRDSISGVSLDEELANLVTFQKAYVASARIISTVDEMLDTVLSLKR